MTTPEGATVAWRVRVRGLVQGVGFRPFVYRLARRLGLAGWARNDAEGVLLHAEGRPGELVRFVRLLRMEAPRAAFVSGVEQDVVEPEGVVDFVIRESSSVAGACLARVPADRVACPACLADVDSQADRRHGYALTTCTDCGPRYSIIRVMPYDRPGTTMEGFALCPSCDKEYHDPSDRRFHAQPIACPRCGPHVWLCDPTGRTLAEGEGAVRAATDFLRQGQIVALQGVGGFQLLVRADQSTAVCRLRERKQRPTKPFAVVVSSLEHADRLGVLSATERALLADPAGPIVLVRKRPGAPLADEAAPGLERVGLMLPTTPLHHLLLAAVDFPVVATSGNRSEEPIAVEPQEARDRLGGLADAFLVHDRPIDGRVDDSVARVVAGRPLLVRLARGYAPLPLPALERWARKHLPPGAPAVLAVGGQQKSALALYTGDQAVLGPHVGDLDAALTRRAFVEAARDLPALYGCRVGLVGCDLHPDYTSSRWAEEAGLPVVRVQHHHAHAVACMVEHGLLDREVLAFTWDGTGLGLDDAVWGGEVLRARVGGFDRVGRLRPFVLPGGEAAVREPARVALALLVQALGDRAIRADGELPALLHLSAAAVRQLLSMMERGVNSPATTSMGRLFDAVAALGLGAARVSYEGEAAARLESAAGEERSEGYALPIAFRAGLMEGDWRPLVRAVLADRKAGVSARTIASRFHEAIVGWAAAVAAQQPALPVVLGGGCFQNARLVEGLLARLRAAGREVYHARALPPGDGALAAGQLAVALASWASNWKKEIAHVPGNTGAANRAVARP